MGWFEYFVVFVLGVAPISEVRGAVIYGLGAGLNGFWVLVLGVLANVLVIPVVFLILRFAKIRVLIFRIFGQGIADKIEKNRDRFKAWKELGLMLFVAVPLPLTGAWTGAIIADILGMDKKKAFAVIAIGVVIASLIVFGVGNGLLAVLERVFDGKI